MNNIPKMPDDYKGKITKNGGYTKNAPREWTKQEIEWVQKLLQQGYTNKEIAASIERSETSASIKIKRLSKKNQTYNDGHIADKYQTNVEFVEYLKPKSCIDVYAGEQSFYSDFCKVISNDKDEKCITDYHLDAHKFCCLMCAQNQKADIIDLDPFGSAYDCFDIAIKMAQKGIVITLGELGHKRWKRLDYVSRYYGIKTLDDFTLDRLIEHIQQIGQRNKKQLIVFAKREWRNIGRVWFEIKPMKITEQWRNKELKEI